MSKRTQFSFTLTVALILVGTAAVLVPTAAMGQDVAVGQATATVQTPLTVTAPNDLQFGTIFQGVPTSVANNSANAGVFAINGTAGVGISVYLQLPDYMATATGDDRMVISFSATDCSIDTTGNADPTAFGGGFANTNPHSLPNGVYIGSQGGAVNNTNIFLGGSVYPSVDQTAGSYSADIILTVAYNGS
ncbi:MAG TPA: hypothetical protein VJ983_04465 [candidate division Zixibacteria bacterium]|nr:hypothetical protein [candidate division Zixibacteria bacterium]